jgi:hypothetical protein
LQHRVVLREDRNDHSGILGPLTLMDGRGVGGDENVELDGERVLSRSTIKLMTSDHLGTRVASAVRAGTQIVDGNGPGFAR